MWSSFKKTLFGEILFTSELVRTFEKMSAGYEVFKDSSGIHYKIVLRNNLTERNENHKIQVNAQTIAHLRQSIALLRPLLAANQHNPM